MTKYCNVTVRISKMTSPMFLTLNIALCLVNDVRKPDFHQNSKTKITRFCSNDSFSDLTEPPYGIRSSESIKFKCDRPCLY